MKGAEYTMWLAATLILALLIGIVGVIFTASSESGIASLFNDFCAKAPWFPGCGGGEATTKEYETAKASVEALQCAINSVAMQEEQPCISGLLPKQTSPLIFSANTEFGNFPALKFDNTKAQNQEKTTIECDSTSDEGMKCTVSNFMLPQDFDKFDDWIGTIGDPQFLVYYNSFPENEDSQWSGGSAWFESIGKIMFATFCIAHFLKPISALWKAGKTAVTIKAVNSISKSKTIIQTLSSKFNGFKKLPSYIINSVRKGIAKVSARALLNREIVRQYGDDAARFIAERGIKHPIEVKAIEEAFTKVTQGKLAGMSLAEYIGKAEAALILTRIVGQKAASAAVTAVADPKFVLYTGIDSIASYFLARIDSEIGKFTDVYENSLVLQASMVSDKLRKDFSLMSHEIPKPDTITDPLEESAVNLKSPVVLIKPEYFNAPTPFYLVSPCHTDIEVKIDEVNCGVYSYDSKTDSIICQSPSEYGWIDQIRYIPMCGSLPNWEEKEFTEKELEFLDNMNINLFSDETTEIDTTDLICCEYKTGGTITKTTNYDWLNLERCLSYEYGKPAEDSNCGDRPPAKITRKKIENPIDDITFYYDESTGIVDYYKKNIVCDGSQSKYPGIEYEEDCPTTIGCGDNNVMYFFNGYEWKWKSSDAGVDDYIMAEEISDSKLDEYDLETVHKDIMAALDGKDLEEGISVFVSVLNRDYDSSGRKTSDDYIILHYPDASTVRVYTDKSDITVDALKNLVDLCNSGPQKLSSKIMTTNTDTSQVVCHKYKLTEDTVYEAGATFGGQEDIEQGLGEDGFYVFQCKIPSINSQMLGQERKPGEYDITTDFSVFFNVTEDGDVDEPFAVKIEKIPDSIVGVILGSLKGTEIVLKDQNGDGKLDELGHYYSKTQQWLVGSVSGLRYSIFNDLDFNGKPDSVNANTCRINAITVTPDMSKYKDDEYNYCYKKSYSTALGLVSTVGAFGISALAKTAKVGPIWGWAIGTAVDCSIAYAQYKWGSVQWPG